ncbi:ROK family protein [Thalassobacillus pellis]|uniref:ROK family protein n=1 Tax=Thalassobacillus pellis TaxID=748008 RepID=UPI00195FA788|nr:ROK family protein [Thalassobacillus pellis]MBM7551518.1 glucokinase [Thalassobacillus pellis]
MSDRAQLGYAKTMSAAEQKTSEYTPYAAGIDIGGTKTLVGLADRAGNVKIHRQFPTNPESDPEAHLLKAVEALNLCLGALGADIKSLIGIGVNVPGLADPSAGKLVFAPFLGWRNVNVRSFLQEKWPEIPVEVANDVNACAGGEQKFGKGKYYDSFLWVTISTGIGGGLVINNEVVAGEHQLAGEIGHVMVDWDKGLPCGCGNNGCLEAHASGTAITRAAATVIRNEPESSLARFFKNGQRELSAESLANAARQGVPEAIDIYEQAGTYLGRAFSYCINIFNPGAIIIGGGVSLSFDLYESAIRRIVTEGVIDDCNKTIPIITTGLGYQAALVGAASLVMG